jgi:hypothetical protein
MIRRHFGSNLQERSHLRCARMQAALKAAVAEAALGVSTGLVVLAGSRCPSCEPEVSCSCPVCPDCICGRDSGDWLRRHDADDGGSWWTFAVLIVGLVGGAFGLGAWWSTRAPRPVVRSIDGGRGKVIRSHAVAD